MKPQMVQKRRGTATKKTGREMSEAGRNILHGLREISGAYASGESLEKRFRVRTVKVAEPADARRNGETDTR